MATGADPLVIPAAPPPAPEPRQRHAGKITCGFCECSLTPEGDYLAMSEKAKSFRDAKDEVTVLRKQIADLNAQLAAIKAAHTPKAPGEKPDGFLY